MVGNKLLCAGLGFSLIRMSIFLTTKREGLSVKNCVSTVALSVNYFFKPIKFESSFNHSKALNSLTAFLGQTACLTQNPKINRIFYPLDTFFSIECNRIASGFLYRITGRILRPNNKLRDYIMLLGFNAFQYRREG